MSFHSKGPWAVDSNYSHTIYSTAEGRYGSVVDTAAGGKYQGAETNKVGVVAEITPVRVTQFTMSGSGEFYPANPDIVEFFLRQEMANANLIAAAPDILEALKEIMGMMEQIPSANAIAFGIAFEAARIAEKAIARAEVTL